MRNTGETLSPLWHSSTPLCFRCAHNSSLVLWMDLLLEGQSAGKPTALSNIWRAGMQGKMMICDTSLWRAEWRGIRACSLRRLVFVQQKQHRGSRSCLAVRHATLPLGWRCAQRLNYLSGHHWHGFRGSSGGWTGTRWITSKSLKDLGVYAREWQVRQEWGTGVVIYRWSVSLWPPKGSSHSCARWSTGFTYANTLIPQSI